jgi:hypothetical protein
MVKKRTEARRQWEAAYEASGKRPGHPIGTRLSDEQLAKVDKAAATKGLSRSAWLKALIMRAIGRLKE